MEKDKLNFSKQFIKQFLNSRSVKKGTIAKGIKENICDLRKKMSRLATFLQEFIPFCNAEWHRVDADITVGLN